MNIGLGHKRPTRRYLPADIDEFIARRRTTAAPPVLKKRGQPVTTPAPYEIIDFRKTLDDLRAARRKAVADKAEQRKKSNAAANKASKANRKGQTKE